MILDLIFGDITVKEKKEKKYDLYYNKLRRRIPIIQWLPGYNQSYLLRDFIAGLTVCLTAIPQGIAYAVVAGLEPQYGLYSSIMGCFVYAIFGSCKDVTIGPTAIMALLVRPVTLAYGTLHVILLTLIAGCVMLALGAMNLGFLIEFISVPVTAGFTSAAAITIASSQLKTLFGINKSSDNIMEAFANVFRYIDKISWTDTVLGFSTIFILLVFRFLKSKFAKIPNNEESSNKIFRKVVWVMGLSINSIVVIAGSVLAYIFATRQLAPFQLTGKVSGGLPSAELPSFKDGNQTFGDMVTNMGSTVITVPLISIMEIIAIAKSFEKGKSVDASQEILALGLSNVFGSFIGSMPLSGSFTRSAINHASGVETPFGGVFTGGLVILALSYLTSLFYYIPKATLSGLIITAMIFMIEYHQVALLWKTKKTDLIPLFVSFFACLFLGIEFGMIIGIVVNLLIILYYSARPTITFEVQNVHGHQVTLITPAENLLFPAGSYIRDQIVAYCVSQRHNGPLVINGTHIHRIDTTVAKGIKMLTEDLQPRGQIIILWNFQEECIKTIRAYDTTLSKFFRTGPSIEKLILDECEKDCNNSVSQLSREILLAVMSSSS